MRVTAFADHRSPRANTGRGSLEHAVQFYADDASLARHVGAYLSRAVACGQSLVVVATPPHRRLFEAEIGRAHAEALVTEGRLYWADAETMLNEISVDGVPDAERFSAVLGSVVDALHGRRVAAYGEMVDLLWRQGRWDDALRLEQIWTGFLATRDAGLLCAYAASNFAHAEHRDAFRAVCEAHTHVSPAAIELSSPDGVARELASLQQQAWALQTELSERQALETSLREALVARNAAHAELGRQLEALGLLHAMSLRLATTVELRPILDEILATACRLDEAEMGLLSLCVSDGRALEIGASIGFAEPVLQPIQRVPAGAGACGTALQRGAQVVVEDVRVDPIFETYRDLAEAAGFRAVHSTPLRTRTGDVIGVLSTHFREPHRPSEQQMHFLDLCARQAVDLIENARLYAELRDADRRKDRFIATLAHELRNPLAPIQNAVQILRTSRPPGAGFPADVIDRQVKQLSRLVDDLLDLSRITTGRVELRPTRVAVRDVVHAALETSRPMIDQAGQELVLMLPPNALYVDADPTRLAQVISNLLNNAAKYTDRGGRITVKTEQVGGDAVIAVSDTGIGIPSDMLDRVFDMFTQVEDARDRAQGGLGIGLTLARQLVGLHGGAITASSDGTGQGSTFRIRLPLAQSPALSTSGGGDRAARHTPALRVLVVDDNVDSAGTMAMFLELMGHTVCVAHDGVEAVTTANEFRPDIVLMDIGLPRLNGHDAGRAIRDQDWAADVVLIALSGWGQDADKRRSHDAGFNHHLVKPVDHTVLMQILAQAGANSTLRQ